MAINGIIDKIADPVKVLIFADNVVFFCSVGHDIGINQLHLQTALNGLTNYSKHPGLNFSAIRSKLINFTKIRKQQSAVNLQINNIKIPYSTTVKFLANKIEVHHKSKPNQNNK